MILPEIKDTSKLQTCFKYFTKKNRIHRFSINAHPSSPKCKLKSNSPKITLSKYLRYSLIQPAAEAEEPIYSTSQIDQVSDAKFNSIQIPKTFHDKWLWEYKECVKTAQNLYAKRHSLVNAKTPAIINHSCKCEMPDSQKGKRYINLIEKIQKHRCNKVDVDPLHICTPNLKAIAKDPTSKNQALYKLMKDIIIKSNSPINATLSENEMSLKNKVIRMNNKFKISKIETQ